MDDDDISNFSPAAAQELLANMQSRFEASEKANRSAAVARADREALAVDKEVAKLGTSEEANSRIEARMASADFQKKWLAGDASATREMNILLRGKTELPSSAETLLNGSAPDGGWQVGIPARDQIKVIEGFRDAGLADAEIEHVFRATAVSQAEHTAARRARDQLLATPEWVAALNAGHPAAKRDLHRVSIILSSPVEGAP
jgi:hypothetical protein